MVATERGFLLIADITGYTRYLSSSELEHAQGILQTLMELLLDGAKPPLEVAQLEGDAVFSYVIESRALGGQTLVEMLEDTYVAFRRAINLMVLNTTCECNACANVGSLDLKFFVHHGQFTVQRIGPRNELVGEAVIAIHRLTKNSIGETMGISAYTAFTQDAVHALDLEGFTSGLVAHRESYDHLGELELWVQDMHPVWEARDALTRVDIPPEDVLVREEGWLPVGPTVAWEIITMPEYRAIFVHSVRQEKRDRRQGRMGKGSVYQCFHKGGKITTQTILDWQPFSHMTTEDTTPVPRTSVLMQFKIAADADGTRIEAVVSKSRGPFVNRVVCNLVGKQVLRRNIGRGLRTLRERVEAELADGTLNHPAGSRVAEDQIASAVAESLRASS